MSWEEAQTHCQSLNMTLLQFDDFDHDLDITALHYSMAEDAREILFLGLSKNKQVGTNTVQHR